MQRRLIAAALGAQAGNNNRAVRPRLLCRHGAQEAGAHPGVGEGRRRTRVSACAALGLAVLPDKINEVLVTAMMR
jgi:hypothetical protein